MGSRHVPHPDSPLTCTAPQGELGAGGLQGRTAQIQGRAFWNGERQNRASLQRESYRTMYFAACLTAFMRFEMQRQGLSWSLLAT
jgi:hypothetical protein